MCGKNVIKDTCYYNLAHSLESRIISSIGNHDDTSTGHLPLLTSLLNAPIITRWQKKVRFPIISDRPWDIFSSSSFQNETCNESYDESLFICVCVCVFGTLWIKDRRIYLILSFINLIYWYVKSNGVNKI